MKKAGGGIREDRDCARCGRRGVHVALLRSQTAEWECVNCGATSMEFVTADEIRARRPAPARKSRPQPKRRPRRQTRAERRAFAQAAELDRAFDRTVKLHD